MFPIAFWKPQALQSASLTELSATISSKPHFAQELFAPQQHSLGWPANWRKIRFTRRNGWREPGDERLLRGSCYCQKVREPSLSLPLPSSRELSSVAMAQQYEWIFRIVVQWPNATMFPSGRKDDTKFVEVERGEKDALTIKYGFHSWECVLS